VCVGIGIGLFSGWGWRGVFGARRDAGVGRLVVRVNAVQVLSVLGLVSVGMAALEWRCCQPRLRSVVAL
jgi:hypothetical protein